MKVIIKKEYKTTNGYFLLFKINKNGIIITDEGIAEYLGISHEYFIELLYKFGAYKSRYGMFFKLTKNAKNAARWFNKYKDSFLISKEMTV